MGMLYLAGAIDLVTEGNRTDWRAKVAKRATEHNIACYNPVGAFNAVLTDSRVAESIVDINTHALRQCDHILFVMGKNYPSVGTPIELFIAHSLGLDYTIAWDPDGDFQGFEEYGEGDVLPIYVRHFAGKNPVFNGLGGAVAHCIAQINNKRNEDKMPRVGTLLNTAKPMA